MPGLSIGFQRGEHHWWTFRERDGTMSMHTSRHGTNWTEHLSSPSPAWSSEVTVEFYPGSGADAGDPGVFRVDNFNLPP